MRLDAFRIRSFRFQWSADLLTSCAFEMETIVLGWYVMVNTGSVLWLTVFGSLQYLGTLAAPVFGVLGDRLGGRTVLCAMRAVYTVLAAVLGTLAVAGAVTPVSVFVLALLGGLVRPNDLVLRNSLIGETIPAGRMMGALGLSRATMDSARVGGALAGAALSTALGLGTTYVVVTLLYATSLALTLGVARRPTAPDPTAPRRGAPPSGWRDLTDGLRRVATGPSLLAMTLLAFLINLTAYPVTSGLLPYAARAVYEVDATGLGLLVASFATGGLLASLTTVFTGGPRHPERWTLLCTALWYALLLLFGFLGRLPIAMATLVVAGFAQNVGMIAMTAVLLATAGDGFRGRVMGVRMLAVYGLPLGLIGSGLLIPRIGYPSTIAVLALLGLACTVLIGVRWRASIWQPRLIPATPD
ncbi:MAG TPA: MFS transporter [Methylomirabilota bacterium]|nr:MFS transporter [Methylomirabilota bacterium]